ncbi:MAG: hypothetical protein OXG60_06815 [Chloroflexi bacterium]|nr:hypothetical protein [Chloroflexota bacterium]
MSEQQEGKSKRSGFGSRIKAHLTKVYIVFVTIALIHFVLSNHSENYRELVVEVEQSVQDIQIDLPDIELPALNATPEPIFFSDEEYGGDAFIPAFILAPGRYRYIVTGENWMGRQEFCGIRGLFSAARDRFDLDDSCEIRLTVSGLGDTPWSITIEPDTEYQDTGW